MTSLAYNNHSIYLFYVQSKPRALSEKLSKRKNTYNSNPTTYKLLTLYVNSWALPVSKKYHLLRPRQPFLAQLKKKSFQLDLSARN